MKTIKIFIVLSISMFFGCNSENNNPEISYYYWKTTFSLSKIESQALVENNVKNLYIRYFDIDLDQNRKPFPLSPIIFNQKTGNIRVISVVYIKNKVMLLKNINIKELAEKVFDYIKQINKKEGIISDEIQIDCDWTIESRDNYLSFIKHLKTVSKKRLSATIRLHQVKYYLRTKIPNVDYGVLMYYNMGKIGADSLNSIYDQQIAKKYLSSLKNYPLRLNVALPIYSWAVHIRNNKVIDLIGKLNSDSFTNDSNFIKSGNRFYLVKNSNIKFGYYFKENDKIKIENVNFKDLKEMSSDLKQNLRKMPEQIIFYDLDSTNLMNYKDENQSFKKNSNYF